MQGGDNTQAHINELRHVRGQALLCIQYAIGYAAFFVQRLLEISHEQGPPMHYWMDVMVLVLVVGGMGGSGVYYLIKYRHIRRSMLCSRHSEQGAGETVSGASQPNVSPRGVRKQPAYGTTLLGVVFQAILAVVLTGSVIVSWFEKDRISALMWLAVSAMLWVGVVLSFGWYKEVKSEQQSGSVEQT